MSRALSTLFDTTPATTTETYDPPAVVVESTTADADIDLARANLKQLMNTANEALREALHVAIDSESPRAFEVVTGMIAAAADLNAKLIASHQVQQKMKAEIGELKKPTSVTNNNVVFTGTPDQLMDVLQGKIE